MKVLAVFGHPELEKSQVSASWLKLFEADGAVTIHKLQDAHHNWQFNADNEHKILEQHDRIVLIYPTRWFLAPSLVKKWTEDIILEGWAYGSGAALKDKEFVVATSCGGVFEIYRTGSRNSYPIDMFMTGWQAIAHMCGMKYYPAYALYNVFGKTPADFEAAGKRLLEAVKADRLLSINSL
jgi:glutathione-regulated potassium-efflux system ancillary protein KefG